MRDQRVTSSTLLLYTVNMSVNFDWQLSEEEFEIENQEHNAPPPWRRWLFVLVLLLLAGSIGGSMWWQVNSAERQLRNSAQFVLDLEHQAYLSGDGELLFSVYEPNDVFFKSAQLRPDQLAIQAAGQTVNQAELHESIIWANVTWEADGQTYQRIQFFEQSENGVIHVATDPNYWGEWREQAFEWGTLRLRSADAQWLEPIGQHIAVVLQQATTHVDAANKPTIVIREDFLVSTTPHIINFPSPRLLGLDSEGGLSASYVQRLGETVGDHFRPITIRFALPDRPALDTMTEDLARAAKRFMLEETQGQVQIELITQEQLVGEPGEWLPTVDAALLPATEELIATGALFDLTQLAVSDTAFDHGDFYPQAWRGAWWDDRMWMIPWNMNLNVMFYDANRFQDAGIANPEPDWNWELLGETLGQLSDTASFIDPSRETLFAYALAQDQSCRNQEDCQVQLTSDGVTSALDWYRQMAVDGQIWRDVSALPEADREQTILRSLSTHKELAIWVDAPINYEYQVYLQKTQPLPFIPISAETPLVMPIRINGMVMSSSSDHPYWVWQWLKYVSHLPPSGSLQRNIPARPSVVRQTSFWAWMPDQLAEPMQATLPFARPLLIGEERYFTWEMLSAAVNGEIRTTPPTLRWFGR